ncbi:MAG: ABC transporter substrate-binding protein [Oceanospirillaceae bacterium]|nr:ABC transporter substrate-binding protein [Oceanospirillaceae bacterium]
MKKLLHILAASLISSAPVTGSTAEATVSDGKVKIGVLADMSGVYADACGPGCLEAVRMAVDNFGGSVLGAPIEVVSADDQNKPDLGAAKVREWIEQGQVDAVTGLVSTAVTGAATKLLTANERIALIVGAASNAFTTSECSPFNAHWTYDVVSLVAGTVKPMVESGKKKWFFITADYTFGYDLEKAATEIITASGGEVLGSVRAPLGTTDFSSYVLQAQASGAEVIAMANSSADLVNALKAASEFGITEMADVAGLLVVTTAAKAMDPSVAAGMNLTAPFYWDMDEVTRDWSARFKARSSVSIPTALHASAYSSTLHYLKAIEAAGTDEAKAVMAKMKTMPVNDVFSRNGYLRRDGRLVHDMYLVRIKGPSERESENDIFVVEKTLPGDDVYLSLEAGGCSFALNRQ